MTTPSIITGAPDQPGTGYSVFGEIDFIVMNRAGNLLVIEQKLAFSTRPRWKRSRTNEECGCAQLARNVDALHSKLKRPHQRTAGTSRLSVPTAPTIRVK